jgi:hypothetical protein
LRAAQNSRRRQTHTRGKHNNTVNTHTQALQKEGWT